MPQAPDSGSILPNTSYVIDAGGSRAYLGWVKGIVQEQLGITSTERYSEFRYLENSSGHTSRPHAWDGYCYHSGFPGLWKVENCYYSHYDGAPATQYLNAWGNYRYCSNQDCVMANTNFYFRWRHRVAFNGGSAYLGSPGYSYDCWLENSSGLPAGWEHRCRGGRDRIS